MSASRGRIDEGCELKIVLGFAEQGMRPSTQFAAITRTSTNYPSSLKSNLDTLQSFYRVGVQQPLCDLTFTFFSESPPEIGEPFTDIEADFKRVILPGTASVCHGKNHLLSSPGITHWQHPSFFAYFPSTSTFEGILGELYSSSVNNPGFNVSAALRNLNPMTVARLRSGHVVQHLQSWKLS
jgi:hypothetical protein